jgi:hypothetical protein
LALLLAISSSELNLVAYTQLHLVSDLGDRWPGEADAFRHFVADVLRAAGFPYESREAYLRHVGGSKTITSSTSMWSRSDWRIELGNMQETVFKSLEIKPAGGLVRSLGKGA